MKTWIVGLLCMVASSALLAAGPAAVRKRVQASMLVRGTIEIAPDGSVAKYTLDHPDQLPAAVKNLLGKAIPVWKFKPVEQDGAPVEAKAQMGLRVVAKPMGDKEYSLGVAGAWFGQGALNQSSVTAQTITYKSKKQPDYPLGAAYSRVSGVVYALLKVGRDGKVMDAVAEQVDLGVVASDSQLQVWQRMLAAATLSALKQDTFNVPQSGPEANKPYWVARIPVTFQLTTNAMSYGQWQAYVPGAVRLPEWAQEHRLAGSPDAVPEGGILLASQSLQLLTPLTGA